MITIERIQEIIKEEFRMNLVENGSFYTTKNDEVYVGDYLDYWYISLTKNSSAKNTVEFSLVDFKITTEEELKKLIRKFKKIRALL